MTEKFELQTQPATNEDPKAAKSNALEKLKDLVEEYPAKVENNDEEKATESDSSGEYDFDGFKVPKGKIPLDGHFTTKEIDALISVAQDEGVLNEQVRVDVLNNNEKIGDRIIVKDPSDEKAAKKQDEEDEENESKKEDKGDEETKSAEI